MSDIKVVSGSQHKKSPSLAMIIDFEETVNPLGSSLKNRMSSKGSGRPV